MEKDLLDIISLLLSGKVAVIGGCREYTGAPYFAAISALKIVSALLLFFFGFHFVAAGCFSGYSLL